MIGDTGNSSCLMFSHEVLVFSGLYFAKHNHLNYIFLPYSSWLCFYFNFYVLVEPVQLFLRTTGKKSQ